MARLIFVHHAVVEPKYDKRLPLQIIPWNCENSHKRKHIRHDGVYLDQTCNTINYAPLYFWAEYEPYSCAHWFGKHPAVHDDLKSARNVHLTPLARMLNTDPYVFGSRFRYICCKKTGNLKNGDVVLFGNYVSSTRRFYFDTVFVCKDDKIPIKENYEEQYFMACIRTSGIGNYAEGKMYRDGEKYFSFVPCRIGDWRTDNVEEDKRFPYYELPYLNIDDFGLKSINVRNKDIVDFTPAAWNKIIEAVKNAKMYMGIHLSEI